MFEIKTDQLHFNKELLDSSEVVNLAKQKLPTKVMCHLIELKCDACFVFGQMLHLYRTKKLDALPPERYVLPSVPHMLLSYRCQNQLTIHAQVCLQPKNLHFIFGH